MFPEKKKSLKKVDFLIRITIKLVSFVAGWIRTLAAVEGIELHEQMANELIKWANGDLRKLLLQLQFSTAKNKEMVIFFLST